MELNKGIADTANWFKKAKPEPTAKDFSTQFAVHIEEFVETLQEVDFENPLLRNAFLISLSSIKQLGLLIKEQGGVFLSDEKRELFLDGLADSIVTAVGTAHCAGLDIVGGLNEVNRSNFSKFDSNGEPLLDKDRKIIKGPDYTKPDLKPFI